ncbi:MAG: signal peptidase I [Lachnospiraceae bacterium]|nr:signal peptidase I [Lachnospiraceae bacterium]
MKKSLFSEILEWAGILAVAFVVALFINNVIITNSYIPTPSMESNLPVGSRLFGFRLNYLFSKPQRGDVVIFDYGFECKNCHKMYQKNEEAKCPHCDTESKGCKKVHFIKRVVGLPGEHIEIKADYTAEQELFRTTKFSDENIKATCGHVYIDGEKFEEDYLNEPMIVNNFFRSIDVVVPDDCYFLLGDNRNNSEDARFWPNQFISIKDIEAKAYIIYWPLNRIGLIK